MDSDNCLVWNGVLDNPNDSEVLCEAEVESDIELDNGIEDPESPEQWDMSAPPIISRWIQPTWKSKK